MSDILTESQSLTAEEFFSVRNLRRVDETLTEVFGTMFGCEISLGPIQDETHLSVSCRGDEKTAIVGLAGVMRGSCEIRMDKVAALCVASAMIGGPPPAEDIENLMCDAVGELCNMVAGGWKNRVPCLESRCSLSIPTVISGQSYRIHPTSPAMRMNRSYVFVSHALKVTLLCEMNGA
jgi:chemotaxis protein CheX